MMILVIYSVRGIFFVSIFVAAMGLYIIYNNSRPKSDYDVVKGQIEYLDITFQDLPNRDVGNFRYLVLSTYPYIFEVKTANAESTEFTVDDLSVGDTIEVYYYENSSTHASGLNKFVQFIDAEGQAYFVRGTFQVQLGYFVLVMAFALNVMSLILWKIRKLPW